MTVDFRMRLRVLCCAFADRGETAFFSSEVVTRRSPSIMKENVQEGRR